MRDASARAGARATRRRCEAAVAREANDRPLGSRSRRARGVSVARGPRAPASCSAHEALARRRGGEDDEGGSIGRVAPTAEAPTTTGESRHRSCDRRSTARDFPGAAVPTGAGTRAPRRRPLRRSARRGARARATHAARATVVVARPQSPTSRRNGRSRARDARRRAAPPRAPAPKSSSGLDVSRLRLKARDERGAPGRLGCARPGQPRQLPVAPFTCATREAKSGEVAAASTGGRPRAAVLGALEEVGVRTATPRAPGTAWRRERPPRQEWLDGIVAEGIARQSVEGDASSRRRARIRIDRAPSIPPPRRARPSRRRRDDVPSGPPVARPHQTSLGTSPCRRGRRAVPSPSTRTTRRSL